MLTCFYLTSIKFEKTLSDGMVKKVTEAYLVNAMSFTEAEARIIEHMTPYIVGEFTVSSVRRMRLAGIVYDASITDPLFYNVKINISTIDEKTGEEKTSQMRYLVTAKDFDSAVKSFKDYMKGSMCDWSLHSVQETKIIDYVMQ